MQTELGTRWPRSEFPREKVDDDVPGFKFLIPVALQWMCPIKWVFLLVLWWLGSLAMTGVQAQSVAQSEVDLASIEQSVLAAVKKAAPAVVRIAKAERPATPVVSGVIVTADGHVLTATATAVTAFLGGIAPGDALVMYLPSGRSVNGTTLGWSGEFGIALAKISEEGPWPHVELGRPVGVMAGQCSVALGYRMAPPMPGLPEPKPPDARVELITQWAEPMWLRSSSLIDFYAGSALFDLQGQLLGVSTISPGDLPVHTSVSLIREHWDELAAGKNLDRSRLLSAQGNKKAAMNPRGQPRQDEERVMVALAKARAATVLIRFEGEEQGLSGIIIGADGCVLPAAVDKVLGKHDLAVLKVDASSLPVAEWSQSEGASVGALVAALIPYDEPLVGSVCLATRSVPPLYGWLGVTVKDTDRGLEVDDDKGARDFDIPLRKGDVVARVEGCGTPDLKTFLDAFEPKGNPSVKIAGDPIQVEVKRGERVLQFRFPAAPSLYHSHRLPKLPINRSTGFPSAWEAEIPLAPNLCGGPVIDVAGHVAGVAVARRDSLTDEAALLVIPAAVVRDILAE